MAGGCNAHGISGSAGIGRLLVESLFDPHPSDYVRSLSPDRFTERPWDWDTARRQAQHVYETYYALGADTVAARRSRVEARHERARSAGPDL